jgi:Nitrile hydratase, alpha chain
MLDLNEVKNQTHIDSDEVTREEAAEISSAEKWAPHLSDGLDALERAIFKVEHQKWMQVLAKAWSDETFKERLMRDAPSALKEFGIKAPAGVDFRVVENTDRVTYITLPPRPSGAGKLPEQELGSLAAGFASLTSSARLPQTWADTWIATTATGLTESTSSHRLPQTWSDTWKPD